MQLRLHVLPLLGSRPLAELTVDDMLILIDELRGLGYTRWSIRTTLTPLSRLLNHAVRRGAIPVSPMTRLDRTERPAVWAAEQRILKRDQIALLLDTAPTRFRTLIATAIFTGLRQGELLGLQWVEIDFDDGVLTVRKSLDPSREAAGSEDAAGGSRRRADARPGAEARGASRGVAVHCAG